MEHAIWVTTDGAMPLVTVRKMEAELGRDLARKQTYRCPDERCAVRLRTVFPSQDRIGGKELHKPHFRAKPTNHARLCQGDGSQTNSLIRTTTPPSTPKGKYDYINGSNYPVRLVTRSASSVTISGEPLPPGEAPDTDFGVCHTSEVTTGHIRTIVETFETPPMPLHKMKLILPRCIGKTYRDCFANVSNAVNDRGYSLGSYIYYGNYGEHYVYANGAISIILAQASHDGRKLGIWVKPELGPRALREELRRMLTSCSRSNGTRVYAFGEFRRFGYYKYSLDVHALGHIWIRS